MRLLSHLLSTIAAASFQSHYPYYGGSRETLDEIVAFSGTVPLSQAATCLDDLLTEEYLIAIVSALDDSDLKSLGVLLQELSPQRFDSLCFALDGSENIESLVSGYLNQQSRWKQAFMLPIDAPVTAENAYIHRGQSEELCKLMEDRPWDILTEECQRYCENNWYNRSDIIGKWLWNPTSSYVPSGTIIFFYFNGKTDEFVEWFKFAMERDHFSRTAMLTLPSLISQVDLERIRDYLCNTSKFAPLIADYDFMAPVTFAGEMDGFSKEIKDLINDINKLSIDPIDYQDFEAVGFDREPFLGKWVTANPFNSRKVSLAPSFHIPQNELLKSAQARIIYNLEKCFPMPLDYTLTAALTYGNFDILTNTLLAITKLHADAATFVSEAFWVWLNRFNRSVVVTKSQVMHMRIIFSHLKPYLIFTAPPKNISHKPIGIALFPVIKDMALSPHLYWSPALLKSGIEWAQAFYNDFLTEGERAIAKQHNDVGQLFLGFTIDGDEVELTNWYSPTYDTLIKYPHYELLVDRIHLISQYNLLPQFAETVKKSLAWIALSSNYKLLDLYLDYYSAGHILSLCEHASLRHRISLMLHLSHKTSSYTPDDEPVNKNSIFFRDWVMCRISDHPADLKLLYWYFVNRTCRNYQGFDVYSGDWILGLQGTMHTPHDKLCIQNLSFN